MKNCCPTFTLAGLLLFSLLFFTACGDDEPEFTIANLGQSLHGGDARTWVPHYAIYQATDPANLNENSTLSDTLFARRDTLYYNTGTQPDNLPRVVENPNSLRYRSNNVLEVLDTNGVVIYTRNYRIQAPADIIIESDSTSRLDPYQRVLQIDDSEMRVELLVPGARDRFFFLNFVYRRQ